MSPLKDEGENGFLYRPFDNSYLFSLNECRLYVKSYP